MTTIAPGTNALEGFFAIQESAGRAQVGDRWLVDHVLRRLVLEGVDLATVTAGDVAVAHPGPTNTVPATAVLLAGGRGSRLGELTTKVPKPLLTIGRTTILERLLESLFAANITDVWISVNYMAEQIEGRIGDGEGYGVQVRYLREEEPLWNAGALGLLPERPQGPVLVLNTDQITTLNFARLVDYHLAEDAAITVASIPYDVEVPYGVLAVEGTRLTAIQEKPRTRFQVNAGFIAVRPDVIDMVTPGQPMNMVELMEETMERGMKVAVFPLLEKWLDVGTPDDLQQALMMFVTGEEV
jgi:NDP-sugar pyrophosphorylase family protein